MDNNTLLANLLAQPEKVRPEHVPMLQEVLLKYPYAQPIHLLLARADASFVPKAALYSNGQVLYEILQAAQIDEALAEGPEAVVEVPEALPAETETGEPGAESLLSEDVVPVLPEVEEQIAETQEALPAEIETEVPEPAEEKELQEETPVALSEPDEALAETKSGQSAEDMAIAEPVAAAPAIETPESLPGTDHHFMDTPVEESHFITHVAESDFFAFEQKLSTDGVPDAPEIETVTPDEPEISFVSKYDDDKLPYTFLWWLAKTRKEHEQIFRPYAQQAAPFARPQQPQKTQDAQAFQQQYVEHIFHIQTPFEVADHLAEYPDGEAKDAKGAEIIEKFLKEDPTIKPPKPEQIDTENKAKKSAEDRYDLVSETLAKIYIEQMLYHKAIDTYKKLSLKYPEKSRYFADLIQSIEKKL